MKEGVDLLPTTFKGAGGSGAASPTAAAGFSRQPSSAAADAATFGKGRYKFFWALGAILLLASWSLLTGTVTLRWSDNLNRLDADYLDAPAREDLDVLEMEEREKMVQRMWDVYSDGRRLRLSKFWRQAFEAAYEELAGDDPVAWDAAVAEIARMSIQMVDLDPPPFENPKRSELHRDKRTAVDKSPTKLSSFF